MKDKRALLIYFTGTYNTRYLVNIMKNTLVLEGFSVETKEIDVDSDVIKLNNYDLVGFSYPIYAFNMPALFEKYIKKLKFIKDQNYFIFKQSGETIGLNNASSRVLKKCIKKAKGKLINEKHYMFPYNIHFRYPDEFIKEAFIYNEKLLKIQMYEMKNNIISIKKSNFFNDLNSKLFLLQRLGSKINHSFYKVDMNKCIKCMKCVNTCPTHNIEFKDNKFIFKNHCEMCMRCSFCCPKDAISIGLLEMWHVNGPYNFKKINELEYKPVINKDTKGFYSVFKKTFKEIDDTYNKYFNNKKDKEN